MFFNPVGQIFLNQNMDCVSIEITFLRFNNLLIFFVCGGAIALIEVLVLFVIFFNEKN